MTILKCLFTTFWFCGTPPKQYMICFWGMVLVIGWERFIWSNRKKNHFIFVYNPNKKQTPILVGIVMWLKTYFRHGFQNLTTNKDTWQISNKNSNNTRYKSKWKWEWIRHILRKGNANIIYQTLQVKRLKWHIDSKKIFLT